MCCGISVIGSHAHLAGADTSATWTVDANGDWGSTTKWSTPDAPRNNHPSTGDDYTAIINATGTKNYTVTIDDAPFTIDALTIDSAQATLLLQTNAITPGPVSIEAGIFELDGSTAGVDGSAIVVDPGGTLELFAGELNGGSATASGSGSSIIIDSGFTYSGGTTVQAVNGGLVILQSGNFTNNSSMPTASNNGIVSIGSGAIVDNTGATAGSSSTLQPGAGANLATERRDNQRGNHQQLGRDAPQCVFRNIGRNAVGWDHGKRHAPAKCWRDNLLTRFD